MNPQVQGSWLSLLQRSGETVFAAFLSANFAAVYAAFYWAFFAISQFYSWPAWGKPGRLRKLTDHLWYFNAKEVLSRYEDELLQPRHHVIPSLSPPADN